MTGSRTTNSLAALVVAALLVVIAAERPRSAHAQSEPRQRIAAGVRIGGIDADGMTLEDLRDALAPLAERYARYPLIIRCEGRAARVSFGEIGGRVDVDAAFRAAIRESERTPALLDRLRGFFRAAPPVDVPLPFAYRAPPMPAELAALDAQLGSPTVDATLRRRETEMIITPGRTGRAIPMRTVRLTAGQALSDPEAQAEVAALIRQPLDEWAQETLPIRLDVPLEETPPRIAERDLQQIQVRLAIFSTSLGSSSRDRTHNIDLARQAVDGVVLMPGDVFSYNELVGPRTSARGYRVAPIISQGDYDLGIGGGICQLSGTLYNAALLAGCEIVTRHRHAFPIGYLPSGRDATVAYGALDLRFKNTHASPVLVESRLYERRLYVSIWGAPEDVRDISLERTDVAWIGAGAQVQKDPNLPDGKKVVVRAGRSGQRVTLVRVVKAAGEVVRREVVSRDYYPPQRAVVRIGIGAAATAPTAPIAPLPADDGDHSAGG